MSDSPKCADFADDLDALLLRWREKPMDDRPSYAEIVGSLVMRAFLTTVECHDTATKED